MARGCVVVFCILGFACLPTSPPAERALAALPAGQAVYGLINVDELKASSQARAILDRFLDSESSWLWRAPVSRIALTINREHAVAVAHGTFLDAALRGLLEDHGVTCEVPLAEATCLAPALSVRLIESDLLAISSSSVGRGLERSGSSVTLNPPPDLPLMWIWLSPARLDRLMADAPDEWVNFTVVARALARANHAEIRITELAPERSFRLELSAYSVNDADASETCSQIEGLNRFAAATLRPGGDRNADWIKIAESLKTAQEGSTVRASWSVPASVAKSAAIE